MPRAILSVSHKHGIAEFAQGLADLGWEIVSTGGTATVLEEAGIAVKQASQVTGHPEIMGGRVKTLHPAIHAGLLARRDNQDDMAALRQHQYQPVDLVAVNLYPFRQAVACGADLAEAMEQLDIGGPCMLRAAAKNHAYVLAVVDPDDYPEVLDALRREAVESELRTKLARKVFAHTAAYDAAVADFLAGQGKVSGESPFPANLILDLEKVQNLRYGENPDQPAAHYAVGEEVADTGTTPKQLHGKDLSFNNLLDIDAASFALSPWGAGEGSVPACVVVKHTTPCGIALGESICDAYTRAHASDPVSAFGGVVAVNGALTAEAAARMAEIFLEVIIAPEFEPEALDILRAKRNLRLMEFAPHSGCVERLDFKRIHGGFLAQHRPRVDHPEDDWKVASDRVPGEEEWRDLRFAWRVVAAVKSNAIVYAANQQTLGIGAGQMSRVDSARIAVLKAEDQGFDLQGAVMASDAFFPFRDSVEEAAGAGVSAIIQPGGSVRDEEVVAAANEHDLAMVFTGRRVFRH